MLQCLVPLPAAVLVCFEDLLGLQIVHFAALILVVGLARVSPLLSTLLPISGTRLPAKSRTSFRSHRLCAGFDSILLSSGCRWLLAQGQVLPPGPDIVNSQQV